MGFTNFPNGATSFGIPVMGGGGIPAMYGDVWFVDYTNGRNGNSGKNKDDPVKTLSRAYALATTGQNDVILINGVDPVQEDAMITWAKNKIHVFGLGVFGATDQEPRIIFSATGLAVASAPAVIKVTGWGNTFTNIRINSWGVFATNANVCALWDAGEGTVYTNCQFNKFTDLGVAAVSDVEARGDSTTWRNCKFGFDTLEQTAARPTLWIKGTGGSARMKNNYFENCYFVCDSSAATKVFIKVYDTNSLAFSNVWVNCIFINSIITSKGTAALNDAVSSISGLAEGNLLFVNPVTNASEFCSAVTDRVKVQGPGMSLDGGAVAVGETIGIAITPA
jgi:hypothetical protein